MAPSRRIRVVGLTGGIASGKSLAARHLAAKGVPIIDADLLARRVVEPGTEALARIASRWPHVLTREGALERDKLGTLIFNNADARAELSRITIPRIVEAFAAAAAALEARAEPLCLFEAPTLLDERLEGQVDGVLLISAPPALQRARLIARNGLTEEEARARLAAQLSDAERRARSRWIIENSGTEEELRRALDALWPRVVAELTGSGA